MEHTDNKMKIHNKWTVCLQCQGEGKKSRKVSKKSRRNYENALIQFKESKDEDLAPIPPSGHLFLCPHCAGSGLIPAINNPVIDQKNFPHVAIIGGGIGGVALAVACLHRGIPFTIYERDKNFNARSQGYGLTLQQAHKAISGFGITSLSEGVISTKHIVHSTDGKIIGEWGHRKWVQLNNKNSNKNSNIHIARQSLRLALIEQLGGHDFVKWGHKLVNIEDVKGDGVTLTFEVQGKLQHAKADFAVGADGIHSAVRRLLLDTETPLRYLGCIVILGICSLKVLEDLKNPLLDGETVFQTANGNERIYIMPFTKDSVMWQLSFPMNENEAKTISGKGTKALKEEALQRTKWHDPIPQIINGSSVSQITGYPVYDRELLSPELLKKLGSTTLIGDAAHPMSPFKGQGANQALLDALNLARAISKNCGPFSNWKKNGVRESFLNEFEFKMLNRSASKVIDSAVAVQVLHSKNMLDISDAPRGRFVDRIP